MRRNKVNCMKFLWQYIHYPHWGWSYIYRYTYLFQSSSAHSLKYDKARRIITPTYFLSDRTVGMCPWNVYFWKVLSPKLSIFSFNSFSVVSTMDFLRVQICLYCTQYLGGILLLSVPPITYYTLSSLLPCKVYILGKPLGVPIPCFCPHAGSNYAYLETWLFGV